MSPLSNLLNLSLKEASQKLQSKEISAVDLTTAYINSSKKAQKLNIYITETFTLALEEAYLSDSRRAKGEALSNIDGIPIGVKDIFLTQGIATTNASKFLSNFIAPYESSVTKNLKDAGYIHMGKVNMDEFAMGSSNLTSAYGPVISPWQGTDGKERVPGGSSGGSAAGVSARSFLAALGTDTGGSIRQPASYCGLVGLKPTYGTCSRFGIIAFSSSLDQAGPITRTIEDNAMLLQHMAGYDEKDSSMVKFTKPNYAQKIGANIKGLRIGIPKEYSSPSLSLEIKQIWEKTVNLLKAEGAEIVDISLPYTEYALAVYYIVSPSEASSNLSRFDGMRYGNRAAGEDLESVYRNSKGEGWGEEVKRRIIVGTNNILSENYQNFIQAAKVRRLIANDFMEAFKKVDVILTPSTPSEAFAINEKPTDPIQMYFSDIFTVTANLAGIPALNVPVDLVKSGLPVGMQLMGNYNQEATLYQVGYAIEEIVSFKDLNLFVKENKLF